MQFSEILCAFINQAREEREPNAEWDRLYPDELAMLRRLVPAIDSQSDAQLLGTVLQMKAELDARTTPTFTILPDVVNMLADELQGKPSTNTVHCSRCGAAIPVLHQDMRFAARYSCPECHADIFLPSDQAQ
jgi:ribosomal protein S27AE